MTTRQAQLNKERLLQSIKHIQDHRSRGIGQNMLNYRNTQGQR